MKSASRNAHQHTIDATTYFKLAVSALLAVLPVLALGLNPDALDSYALLGTLVLATALILFFGVRTRKGSWIVGSILLGTIILGVIFFAQSIFSPSSIEEMSGLAVVPIIIAAPCVVLVGALVDTLVRVTGRRRNRGQAPV